MNAEEEAAALSNAGPAISETAGLDRGAEPPGFNTINI